MFYTVPEFLRNPSRALQLRIRCCESIIVIHDLRSDASPAVAEAERNLARAAWWLALLIGLPGRGPEVSELVLDRWQSSPDYLTMREMRLRLTEIYA